MSAFSVTYCNDLRRYEQTLDAMRKRHNEAPYTDTWAEEYSALLHAWAMLATRLEDARRNVAYDCAPWFEVTQ